MHNRAALLLFLATLLGVALFSLMDGLMKGATLAVGVYSAMLWRSMVGAGLVIPAWRLSGGRWPARATLRLHLTRGAVGAVTALTFFWGLMRLPLAEAIAISFIAPLIALFLAAVVLRERVGRGAALASLLGLAGVVVIAAARVSGRLDGDGAVEGIISVLVSAVLYAWNLILQRQQAQVASPLEVASFMNGTVAVLLLPFAPLLAVAPEAAEAVLLIVGAAVLALAASMLFSWAYARAEAQALVPLEYSAFLWAALFGWLLFAEELRAETVVGAVLIAAGCWIAAPRKRPEATSL